MECPNCHNDLPSRQCPACGEKTPDLGKYCCHCAASIPETALNETPDSDPDDFSSRVLCSDGTCIGVINEQGVCNECGKAFSGQGD